MVTTDLSSPNFNLRLLNLWIGLCKGARGLPKDLKNLGFVDKAIELRFTNSEDKSVVPELIVCSAKCRHTLLLEWKSGNNTDSDQLQRYSKVTTNDVRSKIGPATGACDGHDVVVVGRTESMERLVKGIDQVHPFPVLRADSEGLALHLNKFSFSPLNGVFSPQLAIPESSWPVQLVPFDASSQPHVIAEHVVPAIVEMMHQGASVLLLKEFMPRVVETWSIMAPLEQARLKRTVEDIIKRAATSHFSNYLRWNKTYQQSKQTPGWDIVHNPVDLSSTKRAVALRSLRKRQGDFIEQLRNGTAPDGAAQGTLWDGLS